MSENEKNVPKRRFKEFENAEAWEQRKVRDESIEMVAGGDVNRELLLDEGNYPVLANTLTNDGVVGYYKNQYRVKSPAITVTGRGDVGHAKARKVDFTPVVRLLSIKSHHDVDFLENAINILKIVVESTGVPQLTVPQLAKYELYFPQSIDEEKAIGNFFLNFDNLIILHQRKLEKMKALKKAYLTDMFPAEEERKPKLRFAGFTDDWEQRKFSDYYKICSGYAFKYQDYTEDGVAIVNGESIQHGKVESAKFNYLPASFKSEYANFILKEGDIVVGLNRPITDGKLKIARIPNHLDDSLLYQRAGKIKYINDVSADFSFVLLEKEILKHTLKEAVGSDQPFISTSKLEKWKMLLPKSSDEQYKIGTYFRSLDNLITLHQRKLEKLQDIKKAYLNEMFI
ncbi:restriction endonuclease subunit S [Clostridium botulinum]|uniref:Restriction endonuclease subunit S n=1 Tax=Clostridium botulinum TaxID=1491 RepID=A0A6G4HHN4_CLOBO|nr:restriction endonuclease subunit S [Clostridium botulinum]MBY6839776.1 restriction endonuclease subunit S [Clostridium botulinum]MBY6950150.1 restriction endonuclease subunit S [Clostridium botulinum]MCR1138396.1 restriction endonuclease subunit S [Clostridium botulinum]NFA52539.1 restriction endonuclease subunit S [Clostridium botulinum]NFA66019.1 restriction endonuclease subunit S [Clostridium botulinum]